MASDEHLNATLNNIQFVVSASPEVKSCCNGLVGDAGVQASEVVPWMAVRVSFVEVTVPIYHDANRAALKITHGNKSKFTRFQFL